MQLDIEMHKVVSRQTESGIEHLILARGYRIYSQKQPESVNRLGDLLQLRSEQSNAWYWQLKFIIVGI